MWGWKAAVQAGGDQDGPLVGGSGQLTEQGFGDPAWTSGLLWSLLSGKPVPLEDTAPAHNP